jgi:hypothetical protein
MTLADVAVFSSLVFPFRMVFDDKFLKGFPKFVDWFTGIAAREEVLASWGKIHRCRV